MDAHLATTSQAGCAFPYGIPTRAACVRHSRIIAEGSWSRRLFAPTPHDRAVSAIPVPPSGCCRPLGRQLRCPAPAPEQQSCSAELPDRHATSTGRRQEQPGLGSGSPIRKGQRADPPV
jgi:hypothetical protein